MSRIRSNFSLIELLIVLSIIGVLAGMIAAFLGQGLKAFEAAKYGVYLHGSAGDLAAKEKTQISLIASDIIAKIPEAIKRCN